MAWQLLAIWAIVVCVMVWFVRDERKARFARLDAQARAYSVSPQWRHRDLGPANNIQRPQSGLTDIQREFMARLNHERAQA